jgi:hypothetical protein
MASELASLIRALAEAARERTGTTTRVALVFDDSPSDADVVFRIGLWPETASQRPREPAGATIASRPMPPPSPTDLERAQARLDALGIA